jgi:hypothetical protein
MQGGETSPGLACHRLALRSRGRCHFQLVPSVTVRRPEGFTPPFGSLVLSSQAHVRISRAMLSSTVRSFRQPTQKEAPAVHPPDAPRRAGPEPGTAALAGSGRGRHHDGDHQNHPPAYRGCSAAGRSASRASAKDGRLQHRVGPAYRPLGAIMTRTASPSLSPLRSFSIPRGLAIRPSGS